MKGQPSYRLTSALGVSIHNAQHTQILWTEGSHFFGQEETQDEDDAKNPRQSLLVSLAEACLGLDTVATLSSAVTLMTSFYDVTAGKVPSGMRERTGAVEMRMDNDDIWG